MNRHDLNRFGTALPIAQRMPQKFARRDPFSNVPFATRHNPNTGASATLITILAVAAMVAVAI